MTEVTAFKSLETPVRWRQSLPGFALTSGMENHIDLRIQDFTTSAEHTTMPVGKIYLSLMQLPDGATKVADFGEFLIHENTVTLPITLFVPDSVKRGYYKLHIVHYNADNKPTAVYTLWVAVDSAVSPKVDNYMELASIRAQLADLCSEDNKMLDGLEFSVGDIVEAANRCLQQWKSTAPRVSNYTGSTFPYGELLLNGIIMMLLQSVCHLLGRNSMTYNAEGISINLEQRLTYYNQLMAQYQTLWRSGMAQMKHEENLYGFVNHLGYM